MILNITDLTAVDLGAKFQTAKMNCQEQNLLLKNLAGTKLDSGLTLISTYVP